MGGVLVMGRATYDSIGRPLPGRTTIVVTRDPTGRRTACSSPTRSTRRSTSPPTSRARRSSSVAPRSTSRRCPLATHQVLTEVHLSPAGDAFYPAFDLDEWIETKREPRDGFTWVWWERR